MISLNFSTVLDASAKPAPGFIIGNNFWLGSQDQCRYVNRKMSFHLSDRFKRSMKANLFNETAPFEVEMKIVHAKHFSPWQGKTNDNFI